jgi:septal ring factor EnvC (AmiA/AmiB activator)
MKNKILLSVIIFSIVATTTHAQDREDLERERQSIQRELKEMQGMYSKLKGQSKQAIGQLSLLNKKISLQERYIGSISKEIKMIDDDLYLSNIEIYRLQRQLDTLKSEYARSVVYAYKNRSSYDYLNFIFSATSFNDAVKRVTYLKSYRAYREKQVNTILETQELIAKRQKQQLNRKNQKSDALLSQTHEKGELDSQKKEKDVVLSKLKSQEKDLKKEIGAKQKKDKDLNNAIMAIIRREIKAATDKANADAAAAKRRADEEAKRNPVTTTSPTNNPTTTTTSPTTSSTPNRTPVVKKPVSYLENNEKDIKLGSSFLTNKGRLPWPVDKSYVSIHFGPYKIEGTLLSGDNPGITISTEAGTAVKAVFDGDIVGVFNMGDGMAVTVRHGKYFTTYGNLSSVTVKKGDGVSTGQVLGRAGRDEEGAGGQIDFILMIESKNVNPEPWLRR